mgnify:CR=1 FL=1
MDRRLILLLAVVAAAALFQWGVAPLMEYRRGLAAKTAQAVKRNAQLEEMAGKIAAYGATSGPNVAPRPEGFSLFAFLREIADRQGVKDNVVSLKPSRKELEGGRGEDIVTARLERVPLGKLLDFINAIETAPGLRITQLACRADAEQGMNAALSVSGGAGPDAP